MFPTRAHSIFREELCKAENSGNMRQIGIIFLPEVGTHPVYSPNDLTGMI